jgi:hypothetical protein
MSEAICKKCKWLRETESSNEEAKASYMACGWPLPALPNVMLATSIRHDSDSEPQRWITKKIIDELGHLLSECQAFEPK